MKKLYLAVIVLLCVVSGMYAMQKNAIVPQAVTVEDQKWNEYVSQSTQRLATYWGNGKKVDHVSIDGYDGQKRVWIKFYKIENDGSETLCSEKQLTGDFAKRENINAILYSEIPGLKGMSKSSEFSISSRYKWPIIACYAAAIGLVFYCSLDYLKNYFLNFKNT